jgi:hypothetical protein
MCGDTMNGDLLGSSQRASAYRALLNLHRTFIPGIAPPAVQSEPVGGSPLSAISCWFASKEQSVKFQT